MICDTSTCDQIVLLHMYIITCYQLNFRKKKNIISHLFPCLDKTRNTKLNKFMFPRLANPLIRNVLASEEIDAQAPARLS